MDGTQPEKEGGRGGSGFRGRRAVFVVLGFTLSALGIWYMAQKVELSEIAGLTGRVRPIWLVLSVIVYWLIVIAIRASLISHLLRQIGRVPFSRAYRYICIGFLANNILPARMGEVPRTLGIARAAGIGVAEVTGALALERLLDLTMVALIGIAAIAVTPLPESVRIAVLGASGVLALGFGVLTFIARRRVERSTGPRGRIGEFAQRLFIGFKGGLGALRSSRSLMRAVGMAVVMWGAVIGAMLARLVAFDLPATLPTVLVLLTSISLGVALPSAPGYLGVYHVFVVGALTLVNPEIDAEVAVGFAVFCHLVDFVPSSLLGAVSMAVEGVRLSDLSEAGADNDAAGHSPSV